MRAWLVLSLMLVPLAPVVRADAGSDPAPAPEGVAALWEAARQDDREALLEALTEFVERAEVARAAIPELQAGLKSQDPQIQATAAAALGRLAAQPDDILPELIALFDQTVATPLGPLGYVAAEAVAQYGQTAVPLLQNAVRDEEQQVRRSAALSICLLGTKAGDVVPALIEAFADADLRTRRPFLMNALLCTGEHAEPALPLMIEFLDDEDFHTQYWSCRVLAVLGPKAEPAVPRLIELVRDGVTSVRRNAALALGQIGPGIGDAGLEVLIQALDDPSQIVREDAVIALGNLGRPFAEPAVPAVEAVLDEDSDFAARSQAARTLWVLKPDSELPPRVLLEQLQGKNEPWVAAEVLAQFAADMGVIDQVADILDHPDPETRVFAAGVLGALGPAAEPAVARLKPLLEDPDSDVREVAREALKTIRKPDDADSGSSN